MDSITIKNNKKNKNPFGGILFGLLFIIVGIGLLWYNEGNNVKNIKTTDELMKTYIDVPSNSVKTENNGKLIATKGNMEVIDEEIKDDLTGISIKTASLNRNVEMYQWEEEEIGSSDDETTYKYYKKWEPMLVDSDNFKLREGHTNPKNMEYDSENFYALEVKLGDYYLNSDQIKELSQDAEYTFEDGVVFNNYKVENNYLTNSKDINNPEVGDIRISYTYNNANTISVLAVQKDNTFKPFTSKAGKKVQITKEKDEDGEQLINGLIQTNKMLKWILRAAGVLLLIMGNLLVISPITTLLGYIPFIGRVIDSAISIVSIMIGIVVSLIVIAVSWIFYRPLIGILLLVLAFGIFILIVKISKSKKNKTNE